jgi:hypothetical protein
VAVGFTQGLLTFGSEYGIYALRTAPGTVPGGPLAIWIGGWAWAPGVGLLFTFVPLLFPDGRLPSRRWRPVAWLAAALIALSAGLPAVVLWPLRGSALLAPSGKDLVGEELDIAANTVYLLLVLCGPTCLTALAVRFRRAQGIERQQLKWFVFASAITVTAIVQSQFWDLGPLLTLPLVPSIPIAAGIAILRYRLYDIDRLINRTMVYAALTAILGAVYAGVVLVSEQVFGRVGGSPPSWAVAGATPTAAALFQPARRRIQGAVDRRFNRRRYDAAQTIEAFRARLRNEIDLDTLSAELLAVVNQTVEPTRVSLWLRPRRTGLGPRRPLTFKQVLHERLRVMVDGAPSVLRQVTAAGL